MQRGEGLPSGLLRGDPGAESQTLGWNRVPGFQTGSLEPSPTGQAPKAAVSRWAGALCSQAPLVNNSGDS